MIAGKGTEVLSFYRNPPEGVRCLGYVEDLSTLYASTRLVRRPITHGSGTRLKLIEAGAYGRPMVRRGLPLKVSISRRQRGYFARERRRNCCGMRSPNDQRHFRNQARGERET